MSQIKQDWFNDSADFMSTCFSVLVFEFVLKSVMNAEQLGLKYTEIAVFEFALVYRDPCRLSLFLPLVQNVTVVIISKTVLSGLITNLKVNGRVTDGRYRSPSQYKNCILLMSLHWVC